MESIEKSEKYTKNRKYLNISVLWIFYFRLVLKILYFLKIPHEIVTGFSILCGLNSAFFFYRGQIFWAAVLLHFKDVFDACDGALARMTGRGHLIGRYMDSLGDFFVLTAVVWAIALRFINIGYYEYYFWGAVATISIFIQCSFFNYYQLAYLEFHGVDRLISKRDESARDDLNDYQHRPMAKSVLIILRFLYSAIYGWQDKLVFSIDKRLYRMSHANEKKWYGSRLFMSCLSPLCFGTHIFIIIVFSFVFDAGMALKFISIAMHVYLLLILYMKTVFKSFKN